MAATVEENLRALFLATSGITDLVESRVLNNVPSDEDGGGPLVFIRLTETEDEPYLDAAQGLQPARYKFGLECWAGIEKQAVNVATAVKGLNLYTGNFGDSTVQAVFIDNASEDYQPLLDGSNSGWHGVFLDCEVIP